MHQSQEKFYWKRLLSFGLGFYLKSRGWPQSSKRNWEETRHSKMAFFPAIRGRRKGRQRVIGKILWALWNHKGFDLVGCPWCQKCSQAIPRETKLYRRQIVLSRKSNVQVQQKPFLWYSLCCYTDNCSAVGNVTIAEGSLSKACRTTKDSELALSS